MCRHTFILVILLGAFLTAGTSHAVYFTIELKNGNQVSTEKYWEDGNLVRFYTENGSVALPKNIIKTISKHEGDIGSDSVYFSTDFLSDISEEDELEAVTSKADKAAQDEKQGMISDIEDRLNVIETNLLNLEKNKQTYLKQRETFEKDQEKSRARIKKYQQDKYTDIADIRDRIELEKSKISDADDKISEKDDQIKSTAQTIDTQKRMKERLQEQLEKIKSEQ